MSSMPTLDQLFTLLLREMVFLWIRRPISMKCSLKPCRRIKELKNCRDLSRTKSSIPIFQLRSSSLNSKVDSRDKKSAIWHNLRKPRPQLSRLKSKNKSRKKARINKRRRSSMSARTPQPSTISAYPTTEGTKQLEMIRRPRQ